jgi:hypothetical protein
MAAACATEMVDSVGNPAKGGTDAGGGAGGNAAGGSGGNAGGNPSGGKPSAGEGGSAGGMTNGGGGAEPPMGGEGGMGEEAGGTGGGGKAGAGGSGGKAGAGGSGGKAGAGGGGGTGGSGGMGGTGGTGGSGGMGGTGGSGGMGGSGGTGGGTVNLITNSGFETNTTGWSVHGGGATISSTNAQSHSGTRSLLITGRTQSYQGPEYNVLSVVTPGMSYSVSVWGRLSTSTPSGSLNVTLRYTCNGGTNAGDKFARWVEPVVAATTSWTRLTNVRAIPTCPGGTMSAAFIYVESETATLSYYIDDVVLSVP